MLNEIGVHGSEEYFCLLKSNLSYRCDCFDPRNFMPDNYFDIRVTRNFNFLQTYITFGTIVDPIIFLLIILIGVVLNGTLLISFFKESSIRTEYHIIILNIVINNLITLLVYLPLRFEAKYNGSEHYVDIAIEFFVISVNWFSILNLHIKKYYDISRILKPQTSGFKLTSRQRCILYTSFIWICSIGIVCSTLLTEWGRFFQFFIYLVIYLFTFPLVMAIFSCLTSSVFQNAVKQGRSSSEVEKIISSNVNVLLTITHYLVCIPFVIVTFIVYLRQIFIFTQELSDHLLFTIMLTYLCLFPSWTCLILYNCSSLYRNLFRKYLFRCWLANDDDTYVTMSSLRHAEI
ncbi:hypothetical protein C0J52_22923 [Blattella germanica]|nr:hypothetical protein C0J52_22923 [Blattella germanica]